MKARLMTLVFTVTASLQVCPAAPPDGDLRGQALDAMKRATRFFTEHVATHGGYLWSYSLDFKQRAGEGKATPSQIWVQPPGTPSVGQVFLRAYHATNEPVFLQAAVEAGHALAWGQLASGGWYYRIDFNPKQAKKVYHRRDVEAGDTNRRKRRNTTTFDDNTTQSALRFLMLLDRTLGGRDAKIRSAVDYGLRTMLASQYPNGAWPQRTDGPYDPAAHPVIKARYPETWSRTFPKPNYMSYYTWNDGAIRDCVRVMALAWRLYRKPQYKASAVAGGDFAVLSQMPEPQPVWAQQYNRHMEPAWARKFEPPSVTAGESNAALHVLREAFQLTGKDKYLEPMPAAFAWYKRSKLPDGTWARFYELKTNKPLFFVKDTYELTYDDGNLPTHYGFKSKGMVPADIEAWHARVVTMSEAEREKMVAEANAPAVPAELLAGKKPSAGSVRKIIQSLDEQGRWVTRGGDHWVSGDRITTGKFVANMRILSNYLR